MGFVLIAILHKEWWMLWYSHNRNNCCKKL